jgi:hypothetical protein
MRRSFSRITALFPLVFVLASFVRLAELPKYPSVNSLVTTEVAEQRDQKILQ